MAGGAFLAATFRDKVFFCVGAGGGSKNPHVVPGYIPQPPYEAKPNKPFRPIWDKPRGGEIETHPTPAPLVGPPPLPPPSLFGSAAIAASLVPGILPTFDHLMPDDPADLTRRMKEAQDLSDAEAIMRKLGLIQ
jgi:hypothetical protein